MMGEIYMKAVHVNIWLGPTTPTSDRVMRFLATAGLQRFTSIQQDSTVEYRVAAVVLQLAFEWANPFTRTCPLRTYSITLTFVTLTFLDGWFSKKLGRP